MARDSESAADRENKTPPEPESLIPAQRARRHRIVVSALGLLETNSYEKIQMRDVAEEANVALGTVYRYFASKEHLFAAVLIEWSEQLSQHVQRRPLKGDLPADRLKELMLRILNSFERWPEVFAVVMLIDNTPDPYARVAYRDFGGTASSNLREALVDLSEDDTEIVVRVVNAVLTALLRGWLHGTTTMTDARRQMIAAIDLIFSPPPAMRRSAINRRRAAAIEA